MTAYSLVSLFISSSRPSCAANIGYAVTGSIGRPAKDVPEEGGGLGEGRCRINVARIKTKVKAVAIKTSERAIRLHCQRERGSVRETEMGRREDMQINIIAH